MNCNRTIHFIIVAAGGGTRFGGDIPKQFRLLAGKPVLCRSIDTFERFCCHNAISGRVILVLSGSGLHFWRESLSAAYPSVSTVSGGATRAESVANALAEIPDGNGGDIIMVHDGARPLMTENLLERLVRAIDSGCKAVVPAIAPTDSLMKRTGDDCASPVMRSDYLAVQTPQAFISATLLDAYSEVKNNIAAMTDDASVVFAATGQAVNFIDGEATNIKITNPADLPLAEILIEQCSH